MAKNITIREGDTAKQFTAKKLKMNLVGGGTANFVPEDEAIDYVDLKDHEFKQNGTFNPSDFNCDAFGQVKVAVPANVKEKTITKNGVFNAVDDNCLGYSKVTVNVPGGGGGGPYTVKFFGDDYETVLKTESNVPYGGSASCTELDGTILNGLYFKGWNPAPSNVRDNMNCYPVRGDYQIDENEISDDWETICADKGAHYPLGSYKALVVTIPPYSFDYDFKAWDGSTFVNKKTPTFNVSSVNISLHMVKVAEGEDNSVSTWISTGIIYIDGDLLNTNKWTAAFGLLDTDSTNYTSDWGNSAIRKYLNTHFLENLPESLKNNIVQVNKAYIGFTNAPHVTSVYPSQINKESLDKIWMLSKKELYTKVKDYSNITWWGGYEIDGIDYASVYVPTLSVYGTTQRSCLRTSANYNNQGKNYAIADSMGEPFNGSSDLGGGSEVYGKTMFGFCL